MSHLINLVKAWLLYSLQKTLKLCFLQVQLLLQIVVLTVDGRQFGLDFSFGRWVTENITQGLASCFQIG